MFVDAIEMAAQYTRPLHTIVRHYGSQIVEPSAASLFFVNADGWALTCRHVAQLILAGDQFAARSDSFRAELSVARNPKAAKQLRKQLEHKYGLKRGEPFELYNNFVNCVEGALDAELRLHATLDIALVHFQHFTTLGATRFPVFAANGLDLKQGKSLCRLGFPFAEFTNFEYDPAQDRIAWTSTGRMQTPRFPIEGMVTRHLGDANSSIVGFEMSTPGLRGQSGGPAFDIGGKVWGMQSATNHLDLDFDVDQEVVRGGKKKSAKDYAFLHVGHCVHVDALKAFMREHAVVFTEA